MNRARRAGAFWTLLAVGALVACLVVAWFPRPLHQFRTVEAALLGLGAVTGLALLVVTGRYYYEVRSTKEPGLGLSTHEYPTGATERLEAHALGGRLVLEAVLG